MRSDALVIAHGKSEVVVAKRLASRMSRTVDICSRSGGIQTIALHEVGE